MARLNVEPSLFTDQRFVDLMIRLGGIEIALGAVIRAWMIGQKHFVRDDGLIPADEWRKQSLREEIIEVGLAERVGDRIRICGAEDQFGWLKERVEAGRRGGLAKAAKHNPKTLPTIEPVKPTLANPSSAKQKLANPSKRKQTQASYSYSSSYSEIQKDKESIGRADRDDSLQFEQTPLRVGEATPPLDANALVETEKNLAATTPRGGTPTERVQRFVAAYVTAHQHRFPGQRPGDLDHPKVRGQIKAFAKDHPDIDRACELIQIYFQLDRPWFRTKGWDFLTFVSNLNAISQAADAGVDPESGDALFASVAKRYAHEGSEA